MVLWRAFSVAILADARVWHSRAAALTLRPGIGLFG